MPVEKFDAFRTQLAAITAAHHVLVMTVSVRFSPNDSESTLSWAKTDVFGFAVTYKTEGDPAIWSGELIDAAIALGGSFDLASQMNLARLDQIQRAYPGLGEFVALKFKFDGFYRFHNALCDIVCPGSAYEADEAWEHRHDRVSEKLWDRYSKVRAQARTMNFSQLAPISSRDDIAQRSEFVRWELEVNRACRSDDVVSCDKQRDIDAHTAQGMPLYLAQAFAQVRHVRDASALAHRIKDRDLDERSINLVLKMLTFADDSWGRWRYDADAKKLLFADAATLQQYRAIVDELLEGKRLENEEDKAFIAANPQYRDHD